MKLYKLSVISSFPGRTEEEAKERFAEHLGVSNIDVELTVEEVVPHENFIQIFRLARYLDSVDQYTYEQKIAIVKAYAGSLGYNLTDDQVGEGIITWAERLSDMDDEDIEEWLN
jgi:hypothetical protein